MAGSWNSSCSTSGREPAGFPPKWGVLTFSSGGLRLFTAFPPSLDSRAPAASAGSKLSRHLVFVGWVFSESSCLHFSRGLSGATFEGGENFWKLRPSLPSLLGTTRGWFLPGTLSGERPRAFLSAKDLVWPLADQRGGFLLSLGTRMVDVLVGRLVLPTSIHSPSLLGCPQASFSAALPSLRPSIRPEAARWPSSGCWHASRAGATCLQGSPDLWWGPAARRALSRRVAGLSPLTKVGPLLGPPLGLALLRGPLVRPSVSFHGNQLLALGHRVLGKAPHMLVLGQRTVRTLSPPEWLCPGGGSPLLKSAASKVRGGARCAEAWGTRLICICRSRNGKSGGWDLSLGPTVLGTLLTRVRSGSLEREGDLSEVKQISPARALRPCPVCPPRSSVWQWHLVSSSGMNDWRAVFSGRQKWGLTQISPGHSKGPWGARSHPVRTQFHHCHDYNPKEQLHRVNRLCSTDFSLLIREDLVRSSVALTPRHWWDPDQIRRNAPGLPALPQSGGSVAALPWYFIHKLFDLLNNSTGILLFNFPFRFCSCLNIIYWAVYISSVILGVTDIPSLREFMQSENSWQLSLFSISSVASVGGFNIAWLLRVTNQF